jgi:hypothetical protein
MKKGSGFDADAQAFITAAGITDSIQQNAINTLVLNLKSYSIWTKMKAIYPFVGGTATTHKWNLKDPRDLDAAFRLTFSGGWTHSSTGALPNGGTGFANTFLNDNTTLSLNSAHMATYLRTNVDGLYCDMGASSTNFDDTSLFSRYSNGFYPRIHNTNSGITNTVSSLGFFMSNRVNSTEIRAFQGNTLKLITNSSSNKVNVSIYIAAMNRPIGIGFFSPRETAFNSIGDGLTDTEAVNLYNAVQSFQTTLARNV